MELAVLFSVFDKGDAGLFDSTSFQTISDCVFKKLQ